MIELMMEPPFCPLHQQEAPCLFCLEAEVASKVDRDNCFDSCNVIFVAPSLEQN